MVTVAAAQFPPIYYNLSGCLDLAVEIIAKAKNENIDLIVFPEAWMPGYPEFAWGILPSTHSEILDSHFLRLYDNSVDLSRDALAPVREAAREHGIVVVLGINERAHEMSASTIYNTSVIIDATGEVLNVHRKLMPTNVERTVWGFGDGRGLNVVETAVGRVGVLQCWENYMPLARTAMYAQNVEIYCAPTGECRDTWLSSMQHIGKEGATFVVSVAPVLRGSDLPADLPARDQLMTAEEDWISTGTGVICSPIGEIVAGPMKSELGFLSASIDLSDVRSARRNLDVVGHYSRPDVFQLKVNRSAVSPVSFED